MATATRGTVQLLPSAIERFDEYVTIAKIGQGGMAEVLLALERGLSGFRKLLVIKRLHAHMNDDPEQVQMFLREAQLAARLHHPNIVQTNKVGTFRGQHFLAMEYLEGQPLHRVLQRLRDEGWYMPPWIATRIAIEILDGLHYAHELRDYDDTPLGIVHRDVSPQNMFVTYDGSIKLLDFGIAMAATNELRTHSGLIKGKFSYVAPEQARGVAVDRRADLWSMGVTLWECLAGHRLFRGPNELSLLRATLTDDIPLLTDAAPHVPEELARIVDGALQRDPQRRHGSALTFRDQLEGWLLRQSDAGSRAQLAEIMKELFCDKLEERKAILRLCFAQLEAEGAASPAEQSPEPGPEDPTASYAAVAPRATPEPGNMHESELFRPRRRGLKVATISLVACAATCLALLGGDLGELTTPPASAPAVVAPLAAGQLEASEAPSAALAPAPSAQEAEDSPPAAPVVASAPSPRLPANASRARASRESDVNSRLGADEARQRSAGSSDVTAQQPSAAPAAPVAPVVEAASPLAAAPTQASGRLQLDSVPYAVVILNGRRLGLTPLDVELPAATHTLVLRNPEQNVETTYRVTVPAGGTISRRVALE